VEPCDEFQEVGLLECVMCTASREVVPEKGKGLQNTFVCSLEKMACMHIRNNGTEK